MEGVVDKFEDFFDKFGLMTGEYAKVQRAVFGTLFGGFIITYFKPSIMFKEDGDPRGWSLIDNSSDSTPFPWWGFALASGLFSSVFI